MSSRHFRKACGDSSLPPAEDESGEGYEPLYAQNTPEASMYSGLVLSSGSEKGSPVPSEEESEVATQTLPKKKKAKKNRGKGKASNATADEQMDEIDKSVKEVNALLGEPSAGPSAEKPKITLVQDPMKVTRMHLNVNVELKRFFGTPVNDNNRRPRNETYLMLKRVLIVPINGTAIYDYKKKKGVSMSLDRCDGDIMYFVYDHSPERQQLHRNYLTLTRQRDNANPMNLEDVRNSMHVEGLLELSDTLFRLEEYSLANEIIENVIAYLQYCAHPSFNVANSNVRLEYKYWENRPFHVAVLKFIYMLTNKACHRTALELAKMLLNLDPSDPLAVLFVIDTLALRAREHEWLVGAIKNFNNIREAGLLFNIKYSLALAEFHIATIKKKDISEADALLQEAILAYPNVVTNILKLANISDATLFAHELFAKEPNSFAKDGLKVLMFMYAKMTHSRFREPTVLEWFRRNATAVADSYTNNEDVKIRAQELTRLRHGLFTAWPPEVMRHMGVLKHMAPLIFEAPLPRYERQTCGWDPLQDGGINRYNYRTIINPPFNMGPADGSAVYSYYPDADGPMTIDHLNAAGGRRIGREDLLNLIEIFQNFQGHTNT